MLVNDAEFVENPEGMILERRPLMVRLKRFDDGYGSGENILGYVSKSLGREHATNRKRRGTTWSTHMLQRQLPSELIQRGTQTISELSNEYGNGSRKGLELNVKDVPMLLDIIFPSDDVT